MQAFGRYIWIRFARKYVDHELVDTSYISVLFAFVVIGLIIKKCREKSGRTWAVFILDSSKQMVGASWLHLLNIVFSFALHSIGGGDECIWYWIHITMDTTLGVFVNYQLHKLIYKVLIPKFCSPELASRFKSGDYGSPGNIHWGKYFTQLSVWIVIVSIMKCTMVLIMLVAHVPLVAIASFVLSPLKNHPDWKLIVVMVVTPLVMNSVQFWITDSFTRKKPQETEKLSRHPDANPDSLEFEEMPLTKETQEDEEDMSDFPASPFALLFSAEAVVRRPAGVQLAEVRPPRDTATIGDPRSDTL